MILTPSATAVRLFSASSPIARSHHDGSSTSKILHLIRHAEGTHNLCELESKKPIHHDAKLTPNGVEQCDKLSMLTRNLSVEAVLVSPMTRCLQTATLGFHHALDSVQNPISFVAYEEWRETVNYLCDSRRPIDVLQNEYPHVDFQYIPNNLDPIWNFYEEKFGSFQDHTTLRESNDASALHRRSRFAWEVLLARPERELALVGHSAFFMHMFTPLHKELEGLVEYEDEMARGFMSERFDNCELRTVLVDYP